MQNDLSGVSTGPKAPYASASSAHRRAITLDLTLLGPASPSRECSKQAALVIIFHERRQRSTASARRRSRRTAPVPVELNPRRNQVPHQTCTH